MPLAIQQLQILLTQMDVSSRHVYDTLPVKGGNKTVEGVRKRPPRQPENPPRTIPQNLKQKQKTIRITSVTTALHLAAKCTHFRTCDGWNARSGAFLYPRL
jgi:hypothetical protein